MKKVSIIGLLIILVFTSHAQSVFSKQNLEQASQDDLRLYLKKAKSQKTTGMVLTIAGPVTVTSLIVVASSSVVNMSLDTAEVIFFAGIAATLIGIPVMIVGSSRVNKVKNTLSDRVSIELAPCSFQNYTAQNKQHGITFRIKF